MKKLKLIMHLLMLSLIFTFCSNTVVKNNFETNETYYEKVNRICADKEELKIITKDSLI